MALVQIPELFRYTFGPLPSVVCICHLWIKNVTSFNGMLFYDGILLTNYIFIFRLKNPAAFQDDFWNNFLNKWILGCSSLSQLIYILMPGNQPLNFFLCSGIRPNIQSKTKINYISLIVLVLSFLLHIFLSLKIFLFKRKIAKIEQINVFEQKRQKFVFDIDKDTLIGFAVNFMNMAFLALCGVFVSIANNMNPVEINKYPNYLIMYFWHLIFPLCICFDGYF